MFETQGRADATRVGTLHERDPPGDPRPRQTGNQHNIRSHEEFTHVLDHRRHGCPGPHRSAQRARRRQAPGEGRPPLSEFRPRRSSTQVRRPAGAADFLHAVTGTVAVPLPRFALDQRIGTRTCHGRWARPWSPWAAIGDGAHRTWRGLPAPWVWPRCPWA